MYQISTFLPKLNVDVYVGTYVDFIGFPEIGKKATHVNVDQNILNQNYIHHTIHSLKLFL